jgi:hypothetical protein
MIHTMQTHAYLGFEKNKAAEESRNYKKIGTKQSNYINYRFNP